LISLKALDVTPEYVAELKQSGIGPKDFREVVTEKASGNYFRVFSSNEEDRFGRPESPGTDFTESSERDAGVYSVA
jgi:hypothetical protein